MATPKLEITADEIKALEALSKLVFSVKTFWKSATGKMLINRYADWSRYGKGKAWVMMLCKAKKLSKADTKMFYERIKRQSTRVWTIVRPKAKLTAEKKAKRLEAKKRSWEKKHAALIKEAKSLFTKAELKAIGIN